MYIVYYECNIHTLSLYGKSQLKVRCTINKKKTKIEMMQSVPIHIKWNEV